MPRNGLKIVTKKDKNQKTLEEAISAGKIREEAKKLKRKALQEQAEIVVSHVVSMSRSL